MLMADITMPPEALEAAARELKLMLASIVDADTRATELTYAEHVVLVNAVLQAGLKAWPGMEIEVVFVEDEFLILPLPKENSNGKI